jgi:tetratricopeptide (TPR) repeat protein
MSTAEIDKLPTMDESIRVRVYDLFKQAKEALESDDNCAAELCCDQAWNIIEEPKYGWDSSYMCLLYAVRYLRGASCYDKAIALVDGYLTFGHHHSYEDGPYFWLGTLWYEKGELGKAFSYFKKANKISKGRCFVEENSKYKTFYKTFKTTGYQH